MENYKGGKTLSLEERRFAGITGKFRQRLCPGYWGVIVGAVRAGEQSPCASWGDSGSSGGAHVMTHKAGGHVWVGKARAGMAVGTETVVGESTTQAQPGTLGTTV